MLRDRRDFSEPERALLNLLGPHFNRAYENAALLGRLGDEIEALRRGVDALGQAMIVLADGDRVSVPRSLQVLGLSSRESEVLVWVTEGKTNAEIGTILGASARTIDKHVEHVLRKLGVETRTAAVARALAVGARAA